ncbi:MAG: hypothetical protein ACTSW1_09100 [Candidatus Hodarchaeales archaeon]
MIQEKLRDWFTRTIIREADIQIDMDYRNGKQIFTFYRISEDSKEHIEKPLSLFQHGYHWESIKTKHILSLETIETLLAIWSTNPKEKNGNLESNIHPKILEYLRTRENVNETSSSSRVKFNDEELQTTIILEYNHEKGIQIEEGLTLKYSNQIQNGPKLKVNNTEYMEINGQFYPTKKINRKKINPYIKRNNIPPQKTPYFIENEFKSLNQIYDKVISKNIDKINIKKWPRETLYKLSIYNEKITIETYAVDNETRIPLTDITPSQSYLYQKNNTWYKVNQKSISETRNNLDQTFIHKKHQQYTLDILDLPRLEKTVLNINSQIEGLETVEKAYRENLAQKIVSESKTKIDYNKSPRQIDIILKIKDKYGKIINICPKCEGQGKKQTGQKEKDEYIREDGMVRTVHRVIPQYETCDLCNGKGQFSWIEETAISEANIEIILDHHDNKHLYNFFIEYENAKEKVTNPFSFLDHNDYWEYKGKKYILNQETKTAIQKIISIKPEQKHGGLESELNPDLLEYLRNSPIVKETLTSSQIKFHSDKLQLTLSLRYIPETKIILEEVFTQNNSDQIKKGTKIKLRNKEYIQIENDFYPVPKTDNIKISTHLLDDLIPFNRIPHFIENELPRLEEKYNHINKNNLDKISILPWPKTTQIKLSVVQDKIVIDALKLVGNQYFSLFEFKPTENFTYIGNNTWIKIDQKECSQLWNKLNQPFLNVENRKRSISLEDFTKLEELLQSPDIQIEGLEQIKALNKNILGKQTTKNQKPEEGLETTEIDNIVNAYISGELYEDREEAEKELLQLGDEATDILISYLDRVSDENIWRIVSLLGQIGDPKAVNAFQEIYEKVSYEDKNHIIKALESINHKDCIGLLETACNDSNILIHIRAKNVLEKIRGK